MAKRPNKSDRTLSFLQDQEFEEAAALMLAEYGLQHGQVTAPPVPIDDIVEEHLKLVIEIRDLRAEYPEGDVLGRIAGRRWRVIRLSGRGRLTCGNTC